MKTIGLLLVLFGGAAIWLLGFECYTLQEFAWELSSMLHIPIAGQDAGSGSRPAHVPCAGFGGTIIPDATVIKNQIPVPGSPSHTTTPSGNYTTNFNP